MMSGAAPQQAAALRSTIADVQADGRQRDVRCPAHDDGRASLSVGLGDNGRLLLHCFAGCTYDEVRVAAGLTREDIGGAKRQTATATGKGKVIATYDYADENDELLYQVCRLAPKDFRQRRPDGRGGWTWKLGNARRVLYMLPGLRHRLADGAYRREHNLPDAVFVVEGEKDADRLWRQGLVATTGAGGAGKWRDDYTRQLIDAGAKSVIVLPDNDVPGRAHAQVVADSCRAAGLAVQVIELPGLPAKGDVSDWLDTLGHTLGELVSVACPAQPSPGAVSVGRQGTQDALSETDSLFARWFGGGYDLNALHVILATAAAEKLAGDPLWTLVISGSGNTKTETVTALSGAGALVTSTVSSEGALLSGTAKREKADDATGGLLRRIGSSGVLVIKDVTSILSMHGDTRTGVLAALREVYDGHWERNVGTDGGRTLLWRGRIAIVGACTTAWDRCHDVIATMGDRFIIVRTDSTQGRMMAGRQAIENTGLEQQMRAELSTSVGRLLACVSPSDPITLTEDEQTRILEAANVVTLARTGVDYDYRGDVIDAHAPEAPTRFAKQLSQVLRGAVAIGVDRTSALNLAIRCARDSMPPLRLAIVDDVARFPGSLTKDVRKRLGKPRATVDRQLQALHMLGVLVCDEEDSLHRGQDVTLWRYRLADGIDPDVLTPDSVPEKSPHAHKHTRREHQALPIPTDLSGTERAPEGDDAAAY